MPRMIQKGALLIYVSRQTCPVGGVHLYGSPPESQVCSNDSIKEVGKQDRIKVFL